MGKRRELTDGEITLAKAAFGDKIDYGRVRICSGSGGNPIPYFAFMSPRTDGITLIRTIYFKGPPIADYSTQGDKHLFMHEMTHIWQYQTVGVLGFYLRYVRELAACLGNRHAMYAYKEGDPFDRAMLEAQADMVRDYGRDAAGMAKAGASLAPTALYKP